MNMYIWDFGSEGETEIERMILADGKVLFFSQADYWMPGIDLISRSWRDCLGVASKVWIPELLSPLFKCKYDSSFSEIVLLLTSCSLSPIGTGISENSEQPCDPSK